MVKKLKKVKLKFDIIEQGKMRNMPFKKVCLPSSKDTKPKEGSACWITGWKQSNLKKKLKSVNVHILKAKYCHEYKG